MSNLPADPPSPDHNELLVVDDYATKPFGLDELTARIRTVLRRVGAKAAGLIACVALAVGGQASVAAAKPWFRETDIATNTPSVARCGKASHKAKDIGGEAEAVFDVNGDRIPDIVIVNGTDYYFVALGHRNPNGSVSYPKEATPYQIGVTGDRHVAKSKALGLTDLNRDGKLDLYIGNSGDGSLDLKNPRELANADNAANLDTTHLCEYHGYRTYLNKGNGTFAYKSLGADVNGDTRTPLFADFDGNGTQDMLAFNAPYYGIWWGGSDAPNSLLPGRPSGTFAPNVLPDAIVGTHGRRESNLFQNQHGQAIVDVKGAVVRDFDGDGKPDVIAAAYSDVWDGIQTPPLAPASAAGANVDLNHDGIPDGGWQGAWPHGIIALDNISKPGHIRFRDESATATDEGLGHGNRMDAYETIPVDLNDDGKLDLVVIGIRNFTGYDSLRYQTPIIKVYKNLSTPGHLRFVDLTKHSGLDFMNNPAQLSRATHGEYPVTIPNAMLGGGPLLLEPNLSAGAAVDLSNDDRPDLVLVDRQFTSRNPLTGQEFAPWVFKNDGNFHFTWIKPSESGLIHTAREISYGDLSGNGHEDLVMVNGSGGGQTVEDNNYVWWNQIHNHNHWIEIRVRSASDPLGPLGLGANVTVYRAGTHQILGDDEMRTDFGYRSRRDAVLHFGLANVRSVDVSVDGAGLGSPVTVRNLKVDRAVTITTPPQPPTTAHRSAHERSGAFTLTWAPLGSNPGFTYTLQQRRAGGPWRTLASRLNRPGYAFTSRRPEARGTWRYRVAATYQGTRSQPSSASRPITVH